MKSVHSSSACSSPCVEVIIEDMAMSYQEPGVVLTGFRQLNHDGSLTTSTSSGRNSTNFSSSDAELSSAAQSPARQRPALVPKRNTSLTSLFSKLNIRRINTTSSLERSPRHQADGESSDDDGVFSKLKKKSKSASSIRRRKKVGMRRHDAQHNLHDSPIDSALHPSHRSHSLDMLAEAVCPNCRLHSIATDSGVGSMSLTAPTDSPLWLGWHSADAGEEENGGFLAQTHLAHSQPNLADSPEPEDTGEEVQQCRECGHLFRDSESAKANVRVEFEQDYMC